MRSTGLTLRCTRAFARNMATQTATVAHIPNDPDILDTQVHEVGTVLSEHSGLPASGAIDLKKPYPRLQYRNPALGVNPAFDLALDVIKRDRKEIQKKINTARQKLRLIAQDEQSTSKSAQVRALRLYLNKLDVFAEINDPEIQWRHKHGDIDLQLPIFRLLAKQSWSAKQLHLLMQRITQMSIIPDVIPLISPSVDVRLTFNNTHRNNKSPATPFEVGQYVTTAQGKDLPTLEIQSFEAGEKHYTVAIIDPDVPDEDADTFTTYLHYLKKNVTLDEVNHQVSSKTGETILDFVPPHPHRGTPYHRYTVVVWEQPEIPPQPNAALAGRNSIPREHFNTQQYAQQNGLHAVGITFWRQIWDKQVATVMKDYPEVNYVEKNYKRIKA